MLQVRSHFWIFCFSCLILWVDGINKCGWCLTGGRGCWLKSLHQIPTVSLLSHHSLHYHIYYIVQFLPGMPCPLYCCCNWWGDGLEWGWLIYIRVWVGGQGVVIILQFLCVFVVAVVFSYVFVFFCLTFSVLLIRCYIMMAVMAVSLFFLYFPCLWSR